MKFNLQIEQEVKEFDLLAKAMKLSGFNVGLTREDITLSPLQNRSIHKFFAIITDVLNEMGQEFCYTGLKGFNLSVRYTPYIVKEFFWRPIQIAMYEIESTTELTTIQIDGIADVIIKFFGDKGVLVQFPDRKNKRVKNL